MPKENKTLIVIPAYNEEKNIGEVIQDIKKYYPDIDIVVVDDGSKDKTGDVVLLNKVGLLKLPFNLGYGAALQTGFKYAIKNDYDFVVQIDGDGQHDPKYINDLLKIVRGGKADVAIGSRYLGEGEYQSSLPRKIGTVLFSIIASSIVRQKISDPTSGYQAINKDVLRFYASEYYPTDYPDADVIIMLHKAGFKIYEFPVVMYQSKMNKVSMHSGLKPVYYIFKMFLSIFVTLIRSHKNIRNH